MSRFILLSLPLITLAGCAHLRALGSPDPAVVAGSYDCVPTDSQTGARHRFVAIDPDPSSGGLALRLETGQQVVLAPASGASGRFYASATYAWRSTGDVNVLTDVENIQTYSCHAQTSAPGRVVR